MIHKGHIKAVLDGDGLYHHAINVIRMQEKQYKPDGDLYYCPECDHTLTVRQGKIIDSSCKHAYLNYIPIDNKTFIKIIMEKPHILREGYIHE